MLRDRQESHQTELHEIEKARFNQARLNCWAAKKSGFRRDLASRLRLPFIDRRVTEDRKLQSIRLATKTSVSPREPEHRITAKVSPRSMGGCSQMFKKPPEERGRAITDCMDEELETLDVSRLPWTLDRLALVGRCKNLLRCDISGIGATDSAVIALQQCLRLRSLNISQSEVSAKTLSKSIPKWRHLQKLTLNSNPQLFDYPGHGSEFMRSKWEQYEGVGKRALKNVYTFLHRCRVLSVADPKTMKQLTRKNVDKDNRFEKALLNAMLLGNVRMLFGQLAVHGGDQVTKEEVRGLANLLGLGEGVENEFPMSLDDFAFRLAIYLKIGFTSTSENEEQEEQEKSSTNVAVAADWEGLAWRVVGVANPMPTQATSADSATNDASLAAQIPTDWGAVVLRSISNCKGLHELNLANLNLEDFSLGGFLPPPTTASHNQLHVDKWHEYNAWIFTGRWTSVKLTAKDLKSIENERIRQKELSKKINEFEERLKNVTTEIKATEKNISEHGRTKKLVKALEKCEKRYTNIQNRIVESKAKIEQLEDEISNMGSINNSEIRPILGPRLLLREMNLSSSNLSNEGIAYLAARMTSITKVKLSCIDEGRLTNHVGVIIVRAWPHLKSIDFSGCPQIGDQVVIDIVKSLPSLTSLSLGGCNVTEKGTNAIAESCDSLVDLDLTGCIVLESALNNILRGNPQLKVCRLDFVDLEDEFLTQLRSKYQHVTILSRRKTHFVRPPPRVFTFEAEGKGKKKGKGGKKKGKKKKGKKKK